FRFLRRPGRLRSGWREADTESRAPWLGTPAADGRMTTTAMTPTLERVLDRLSDMRSGKFDLGWMHANPDGWGTRATPSAMGLTIADINVGKYGIIPERGAAHGSMAPRGCEVPADTPALGTYDVDDRGTVWADNCAELYEEAVARQWSSAR